MRRSSSAPVRRSEPNTEVHSSNGRFDVTIVEPRSYRCENTSNNSSAPVGILEQLDQNEAERFIGKDEHLDALEFCFDCLVRLLTIASGIANDLGIKPKVQTIADSDILRAEITDENGTRQWERDRNTGQLVEVQHEGLHE